MSRADLIQKIKDRGDKITAALRLEMAAQGLKDRVSPKPTMMQDTKVWVDFVQGFDLTDEDRQIKEIFKKIKIGYPKHGLFRERGDGPGIRQPKPLFAKVLPLQVEALKGELAELYGKDISNLLKINIPGIYSSSKNTVVING